MNRQERTSIIIPDISQVIPSAIVRLSYWTWMLILSPMDRSKTYQKRNRVLDIRRSSRSNVSVEGISELEWKKRDERTGIVGAGGKGVHVTARLARGQQYPTESS